MKPSKKTILIADDDDDLRMLVQVTLDHASYEIATVGDGLQTLDVVLSSPPDLLIIDWMMPGLTGDEVVRRLRGHPRTAQIPIIMLTAKDGQEFLEHMMPLQLSGYLVKPFSPLALIRIVREVLSS